MIPDRRSATSPIYVHAFLFPTFIWNRANRLSPCSTTQSSCYAPLPCFYAELKGSGPSLSYFCINCIMYFVVVVETGPSSDNHRMHFCYIYHTSPLLLSPLFLLSRDKKWKKWVAKVAPAIPSRNQISTIVTYLFKFHAFIIIIANLKPSIVPLWTCFMRISC